MNPFLRPLFKPILNRASRAAYYAQEQASKAYQGAKPYAKNYMDAAAGNQGRFKQGVALGSPFLAYGVLPERTTIPNIP